MVLFSTLGLAMGWCGTDQQKWWISLNSQHVDKFERVNQGCVGGPKVPQFIIISRRVHTQTSSMSMQSQ